MTKIIDMSNKNGSELEDDPLLEVAKPELKRPAMYTVIIMNDDYTPMDFVVQVLEMYFNMGPDQAVRLMLEIHQKGQTKCGIYTRDVAETKSAQVVDFARQHDHPLLCKIEKV